MKNITLLSFILFLIALQTEAQDLQPTSSLGTFNFVESNQALLSSKNKLIIAEDYFNNDSKDYEKEIKKAKRLKIAGWVFTSLGAAGTIATISFVIGYSRPNNNNGDFIEALVDAFKATDAMAIGYPISAVCLTAGIPLTIVGHKKSKRIVQPKEL